VSQRYGTVHARFWTDEKVQAWSDRQKIMALYMLTGPHGTIAGAMQLPLQYMAADLGWTLKDCQETVSRLSTDGFLTYCERSCWVVITNRLDYDPPKNPASFQGVLNALADLPRSHPGWPKLLQVLQGLSARSKMPLPWSADDLQIDDEPSGDSPETVARVSAASASATASAAAAACNTPSPSAPSARQQDDQAFEKFWKAYPRKKAKDDAAKAYRAALKKADAETIRAGLDASVTEWREQRTTPRFIPYPASWLNGACWADGADRTLPQPPNANGVDPLGHLSPWEQSQLKLRAEEQVRVEGLCPYDGDGMQRVRALMLEAADAQRRSA
jgi:hypothetical protein